MSGKSICINPILVSKKVAAASLSISIGMLDKLVRQRAIDYVRIGRRVLFRREALNQFAEANRAKCPRGSPQPPGLIN
jgi:excisionase family DNA binding protein